MKKQDWWVLGAVIGVFLLLAWWITQRNVTEISGITAEVVGTQAPAETTPSEVPIGEEPNITGSSPNTGAGSEDPNITGSS